MATEHENQLTTSLKVLMLAIIGYACQLAYTRILTRNLSLTHYGDFAVAWQCLFLVSQVLAFGSGLSAQKFLTRYILLGDRKKKLGFIFWLRTMLGYSTMMLCVVYTVFWMAVYAVEWWYAISLDHYHLAMSVVIFAPALTILSLAMSMVLSHGYTTLASMMGSVMLQGVQLLVILVFFTLFAKSDTSSLPYLLFSILAVLMTLSLVITLWIPGHDMVMALGGYRSERYHDKAWFGVAQSACMNQVMFTVAGTVDLYILEIFSRVEDHVGLFSICVVIAAFYTILQNTINQQLTTQIMVSTDMQAKDMLHLQRSLDFYNVIKFVLLLVCLAASWTFRKEVLGFFHVESTQAYQLLPILFCNSYLADNRYQFGYLIASQQIDYANKVEAICLLIMVVLALLLVFPYSIFGVAWANTITKAIYKFLLTKRCRQLSPLRLNWFV